MVSDSDTLEKREPLSSSNTSLFREIPNSVTNTQAALGVAFANAQTAALYKHRLALTPRTDGESFATRHTAVKFAAALMLRDSRAV